jgi:hypothetical protein
MATKSCDGNFQYLGKNEKVTMILSRNQNNGFIVYFKNAENMDIHSEMLNNKKTPYFDNKNFYILGIKLFTVEDASTARFNDMRTFFDKYFNVQVKYISYEGNNYEGETKDNIPNGQGLLYYENTNNAMIRSVFINGKPDGKTILYSKDQNIEVICDDVVNMILVGYAIVLFKNIGKEISVDMSDFDFKNKIKLNLNGSEINKYVNKLANFGLLNDSSVVDVQKFVFLNKTQTQQYEEMFGLLTETKNQLQKYNDKMIITAKYFNYLLVLYFPFFLYLLCNMK